MQTRTRRIIRAALLSLLIAASFLTTGGWFCADGRACLPALSPTCCCGEECDVPLAAAERCEDAECSVHLAAGDCGCYQDLPALATLPAAPPPLIAARALLPAPGFIVPPPPAPAWLRAPAAESPPPPRFLVSPRDLRAPPAA